MQKNGDFRLKKLFLFLYIYLFILIKLSICDNQLEKANFFQSFLFLKNLSSYYQSIDLKNGKPDYNTLGSAAVGNGYCFGLLGTKFPQNTLYGLIGPDYETNEKFFSSLSVLVYKKDKLLTADKQSIYKVKRRAIIVTEEIFNEGLILWTVTFSPPEDKNIIIKNISPNVVENLSLVLDSPDGNHKMQTISNFLSERLNNKFMVAGFLSDEAKLKDNSIELKLNKIEPNKEIEVGCILSFSYREFKKEEIKVLKVKDLKRALNDTYLYWKGWFEKNAMTVNSNWAHLNDLIDDTNILNKVQQASSGAISPMAKYSGMWCRDSFGSVRFLLLNGNYQMIKEILRYYDYASRMIGFRNRYPLDLTFNLNEPPLVENLEKFAIQQGDDPNLLILQFYSYFKETRDLNFIKEHYRYLRKNFFDQKISNEFLLPFHGDETYQVYALHTFLKPLQELYSADTAFEYVSAGRAMKKMCKALKDKIKLCEQTCTPKLNDTYQINYDVTLNDCSQYIESLNKSEVNLDADIDFYEKWVKVIEQTIEEKYFNLQEQYYNPIIYQDNLTPYKFPFLNINLRPFWINYANPYKANTEGWKRQKNNILNSLKALKVTPDTIVTSKKSKYITGMLPGYLLYCLSVINSRDAEKIFFKILEEYGAPLGEFSENYQSSRKRLYYTEIPTNYRPWESSINAEALLFYLTGAFYDDEEDLIYLKPRLPEPLKFIEIKKIFIAGKSFNMRFEKKDGKMYYNINNLNGKHPNIKFVIVRENKTDKIFINNKEVRIEDKLVYDEENNLYIGEYDFNGD